jgi:hypothetical protein
MIVIILGCLKPKMVGFFKASHGGEILKNGPDHFFSLFFTIWRNIPNKRKEGITNRNELATLRDIIKNVRKGRI